MSSVLKCVVPTMVVVVSAWTAGAVVAEGPSWEEELQSYLERAAAALNVPGAVVVVAADDGVTVLSQGVRCVGGSAPVTPRTSFGIGSLTKAFTATAAADLVGNGLLDWDTRVRELIPDLELADPMASGRVTLRDLLAHRSGLASEDILFLNVDAPQAWVLPRLALAEPLHEFRDRFSYSDLGYVLAGEMIGRAAGSSWRDVVSERLLEPIGMAATTIGAPSGPDAEAACGHRRWQGQLTPVGSLSLSVGAPSHGLYSNAEDMARWLAFLLGSGEIDGVRVVASRALQHTWTPQVTATASALDLRSYGLGWYLSSQRGRIAVWHQGGGLGFTSQVRLIPEQGVAVAVLCNRMSSGLPDLVATRAAELVLGEPPQELLERAVQLTARIDASREAAAASLRAEKSPGAPPSLEPEAYIGCYEHPALGQLELAARGAALVATYHGIELAVEHLHDDEFVMSSLYTDDVVASFDVMGDTTSAVAVTLGAPPPGRVFIRVAGPCAGEEDGAGG